MKFFVHWMMPQRARNPCRYPRAWPAAGVSEPSGLALNWMKTRFQISMHCGVPGIDEFAPPSPAGVRSMWISLHGPHGPVSPIIQKLSLRLPGTTWSAGRYREPQIARFGIGRRSCRRRRSTWRKAGPSGNPQTLDEKFPGPIDRFLLEIIAETPVAEHLEKGVVIGVEADVFEVVVFAAGADAFLRVGGARRACTGRSLCPRKIGTNWFMPALVNSRFGASGSSELDGTMVCCFSRRNRENSGGFQWMVIAVLLPERQPLATVDITSRASKLLG